MDSQQIGKFVIVRTKSEHAGVHAGILLYKEKKEVRLMNAYMIWMWNPAKPNVGGLIGVAIHGVGPGSKVTGPATVVELTEVVEIIATTSIAQQSISEAKWGT